MPVDPLPVDPLPVDPLRSVVATRYVMPLREGGSLSGVMEALLREPRVDRRRPLGQRFRWLTAPRSTVVHAGAVHSGLTADPETEVERLLNALVR